MRNLVTKNIRKETIEFNNTRVRNANDENEMWRVVNDVITPNKEQNWRIKIEDETITDELRIANEFNHFFINKIANLKKGIAKEDAIDPLEQMKLPANDVKSKLSLKTINKNELKTAMKKLKKKKSSGCDNLTQEQLILGAEALYEPLLNVSLLCTFKSLPTCKLLQHCSIILPSPCFISICI